MSVTESASPTSTASTRRVRDVRAFWRVLLAVIAPLPMLFMGVFYILSPVDGGEDFPATVTAFAGARDRLELLEWLSAPFLMLLVPAMFAVAWVSRRRTPRLTTAGALLGVGGVSAGFGLLPGTVHAAYITVRDGLDVTTVDKLSTATSDHPLQLLGGLLFILGITVGLLLLGIALWRSHAAPAWMGIALALGGFTHPFMPGHVAAGVGLIITAIGFAGASLALLRARNDDFDLPPLSG